MVLWVGRRRAESKPSARRPTGPSARGGRGARGPRGGSDTGRLLPRPTGRPDQSAPQDGAPHSRHHPLPEAGSPPGGGFDSSGIYRSRRQTPDLDTGALEYAHLITAIARRAARANAAARRP
ncbi:unnamed protein product, partial [Nesidiocoris tenuis]